MKYELTVKEGISTKTGKPYTIFEIVATAQNAMTATISVSPTTFPDRRMLDLIKECDKH